MSKTTIFLLIILLVTVGFLFIIFKTPAKTINNATKHPRATLAVPRESILSLSTQTPIVAPGQMISIAVLIHDPHPEANLIQLELAYDPTLMTVETITPGTFFTTPSVILQTIDPLSGRVSYALRCSPSEENGNTCLNMTSTTVATITARVSPYLVNKPLTLSFLPKTAIRTRTGATVATKMQGLQITIGNTVIPQATASGRVLLR